MHFNSYVDHRETRLFEEIVLYSGWLACGSCLTTPHLPECVIRNFGYTRSIPKYLVVSVPPALTHRQVNDMFDDYHSHLVPEEARIIIFVSG